MLTIDDFSLHSVFSSRDDNSSSSEAHLDAFAYIIAAVDGIIDFDWAIALVFIINQQPYLDVALVEGYEGDLVSLVTLSTIGDRGGASEPAEPAEPSGFECPDVPWLDSFDWVAAHAAQPVRGHGRYIRTTRSDEKAYNKK